MRKLSMADRLMRRLPKGNLANPGGKVVAQEGLILTNPPTLSEEELASIPAPNLWRGERDGTKIMGYKGTQTGRMSSAGPNLTFTTTIITSGKQQPKPIKDSLAILMLKDGSQLVWPTWDVPEPVNGWPKLEEGEQVWFVTPNKPNTQIPATVARIDHKLNAYVLLWPESGKDLNKEMFWIHASLLATESTMVSNALLA
jgi:hypothetical protein